MLALAAGLLSLPGLLMLPATAGAGTRGPHDLGTLGGRWSYAVDVNEHGAVAGDSETADGAGHAFRWRRGSLLDLGTLGGRSSTAKAINDRGMVVGRSETADGQFHAFVWARGRMVDLGTLGGRESEAVAINDNGAVVGWSTTSDGRIHAVRWHGATMTDLGTVAGDYSSAYAINDAGQVAGVSSAPDGMAHAVRWDATVPTDLGRSGRPSFGYQINAGGLVAGNEQPEPLLPGRAIVAGPDGVAELGTLGGAGSSAADIDSSGRVVGTSNTETGEVRGFFWDGQTMVDVGSFGGQGPISASVATALNDRGQVVGSSVLPDGSTHAFVWRAGMLTDLGTLEPGGSSSARDVNEYGVAVGSASVGGANHAALWRLGR